MQKKDVNSFSESIDWKQKQNNFNQQFSEFLTAKHLFDLGLLLELLPKPPARVLDCGCGMGWISHCLAKKGFDVTGIDISQQIIDAATKAWLVKEQIKNRFICADYEKIDFTNEFDAIIFYASLHHTNDLNTALKNAFNALKPGGVLITIEPGKGNESAFSGLKHYQPPWLLVKSGQKAGFKAGRIYQQPDQLLACLYDRVPSGKAKQLLWKIPGFKIIALFCSVIFLKKFNGVVVMKKAF